MKKIKKVTTLLLALAMVCGLAACGNGDTTTENEEDTEAVELDEEIEEAAEEDEKEEITDEDLAALGLVDIPEEIAVLQGSEDIDLLEYFESDNKAVLNMAYNPDDVDFETEGEYPLTITVALDGETVGELLDAEIDDDAVTYGIDVTVDVVSEDNLDAWAIDHGDVTVLTTGNAEYLVDVVDDEDTGEEPEETEDAKVSEDTEEADNLSAKTDSAESASTATSNSAKSTGSSSASSSSGSKSTSSGTGNSGSTKSCSHTYDSGKITKYPTCGTTGTKTYTCTKCGATKTETIAKTNLHNYKPVYKTVHHDATGHYEDVCVQEAVYENRNVCNVCFDYYAPCAGGDSAIYVVNHIDLVHDGVGGYTDKNICIQDAVYETQWVQDSAAYDETVIDYFQCADCGAKKYAS